MRTQHIETWWMKLPFLSQIKIKQRYVWTKREFTEEGSTLGELVDQVSPLMGQMSRSLDFLALEYFFCVHWRCCLSSPPGYFHQFAVFSICSLFFFFFSSAPPISPQGSLKFHRSPRLCLAVISSQWTEHGDGSPQYACSIHTDKGGNEECIYTQPVNFSPLLQSVILLCYISLHSLEQHSTVLSLRALPVLSVALFCLTYHSCLSYYKLVVGCNWIWY